MKTPAGSWKITIKEIKRGDKPSEDLWLWSKTTRLRSPAKTPVGIWSDSINGKLQKRVFGKRGQETLMDGWEANQISPRPASGSSLGSHRFFTGSSLVPHGFLTGSSQVPHWFLTGFSLVPQFARVSLSPFPSSPSVWMSPLLSLRHGAHWWTAGGADKRQLEGRRSLLLLPATAFSWD